MGAEVVLPDSPDDEVARKAAIPRFHDVRPQAIVRCQTTAEVAEAIAPGRDRGRDGRG
jgi:hypothetical protein